jgi:hypothetical protein
MSTFAPLISGSSLSVSGMVVLLAICHNCKCRVLKKKKKIFELKVRGAAACRCFYELHDNQLISRTRVRVVCRGLIASLWKRQYSK